MWPTFETEKPVVEPVFTRSDVALVSLVWGFTIGFGYFVVLHAIRVTARLKRWSIFVALIWLEIIGCILYGMPSILYTNSVIPHSFWLYFCILTGWILQLQCLVQIIVNRICILIDDPRHRVWLKMSMLIWIGAINLAVALIWMPARLQINETYIHINDIFDRIEKVLYLITDACLNAFFVYVVKKRLVGAGLKRYDQLVKFNLLIIWASLAMDVMIIAMMSLNNTFLYTIFHPLAYIVKLEIEMTMSNLIILVALHVNGTIEDSHPGPLEFRRTDGRDSRGRRSPRIDTSRGGDPIQVTVNVQTVARVDDLGHIDESGITSHDKSFESFKMSPLSPDRSDNNIDEERRFRSSSQCKRQRLSTEVDIATC
ncbi:hypothetical protein K435DRAFT_849005 [Dendrothele bispora CBS 962.96]|uniref:Integral membrane protein n=1 Tax=Dendrothele bispora (strain CBS 962.96) TaxID=1314807 RepID=A0A4S8MTK9_DENBC|nr:hypothetical protein K435DRAFT_849005 [Dendrothele bispora CBS 962.96]